MACFSWVLLEQLMIWAVIVVAIVLIIRLFVPMLGNLLGGPWSGFIAFLGSVLNIILGAVVTIALIILVFDLLICAISGSRLLPIPYPR